MLRLLRSLPWLLVVVGATVHCSDDPERPQGKSALYVDSDGLNVLQLTLLQGRCCGRLVIDSKDVTAETDLLAFAELLTNAIPLDGSVPQDDAALVALIPEPPLSGDLAGWEEDGTDLIDGPWLVSTDAFEWINGSGQPWADNGFEAAAGETYVHQTEGWQLRVELVNMSSVGGAERAFDEAEWDSGTPQ